MTKGNALAAIVVVAVVAAAIALLPQPGGFRAWLAEVRDGDDDSGWDLLGPEAQRAYSGNREAYLADVAAADWGALDLGAPTDDWSDDGFVHVAAQLRSQPATVPKFLLERRIVHGVCHEGKPVAIGVFEDRRPFRGSSFGPGGMSGSQRRCNTAFGAS